MDFPDDSVGRWRVVNDTKAIYVVHACIGKGQAFLRVCNFEPAWDSEHFEPFTGEFYGVGCQINSNVVCATSCKLDSVRSYSTSDFNYLLPSECFKASD